MFGYLATATSLLELVPGVIILAQRQTVLVAKQAAEVDLLSGGRLRLGGGIGWNAVVRGDISARLPGRRVQPSRPLGARVRIA
jgi:alkanesulfonate monooxygenase SsuD/methylene tetrahydromethanopterin reductase-like flavin-dependent oxidoreductase (luciferase family)